MLQERLSNFMKMKSERMSNFLTKPPAGSLIVQVNEFHYDPEEVQTISDWFKSVRMFLKPSHRCLKGCKSSAVATEVGTC